MSQPFIFPLCVAILAAAAYYMHTHDWFAKKPIDFDDYKVHAKFNLKEVPVTYYELDKINEVIPKVINKRKLFCHIMLSFHALM